MSALTNVTSAVGAASSEGDVKNWLVSVYNYLVGLFGTDGTKSTAISTLGASPFPAGTQMLFAQGSAPTGWTKQTTHNDKALRVVSGSGGGSGGSVAFSTLFGRTATDGSSLSIAQLASHPHNITSGTSTSSYGSGIQVAMEQTRFGSTETDPTVSAGSGATHAHGLDLRVQYVDVIIASKD
jgi:hypothetical protein